MAQGQPFGLTFTVGAHGSTGRSVRRKPDDAKNLSLRRGALLALIPAAEFTSLNTPFDYFKDHRTEAIHLLTRTSTQCLQPGAQFVWEVVGK